MKIGIIDIGSNSMRVVVVQIGNQGAFKIIDELKENVRLGENMNKHGELDPGKMLAALETLKFFQNLCQALQVQEIICVATEAVRRAANQALFLEMVRKEINLNIRVISGMQEAYYDYFGVVNTLNLPDGLIMDIGGSSTELILMRDRQIEESASLPFGAITIAQMFHLESKVSEESKQAFHKFLGRQFSQISWIKGNLPLIGIGGSFRNIGKINRKAKNYPLDITHNYSLPANAFLHIEEMFPNLSLEERKSIKGISKERADILPGALAEIAVLLKMTGISDIIISGSGLREGLLYEYLLKDQQPIKDVLDFSLQNTMNNYEMNQTHAYKVWDIARQLYEQFQINGYISSHQQPILKTAALLHDCGINLSYYDHHKHSFYMILNSRINGLTHRELIMAALVAYLHRKDEIKIVSPYRTILSDIEIQTAQKLGVLLRIAESLDRRQNSNITHIDSFFNANSIHLKIRARTNPDLEIKDALNVISSFRKIFGRQLFIEP